MIRFVLHRLLLTIPALFGLLVLTFIMLRVLPNDPSAALAGENATPAQIAAVRKAYGFDEPLWKQFVIYVGQAGSGDLGNSIISNRPVVRDIAERLPATIELTFVSLIFAACVGIPLGTMAAVWHNSLFDHAMRVVTVAGLAIASFWFAIILQTIFSMELDWLPLRGRFPVGLPPPTHLTGLYLIDSLLTLRFDLFGQACTHILMPALTLSLGGLASISRFTRAGVLETMQKEFVHYAEAAGYTRRRIIWVYVLRNSVVGATTQIGLLFGGLISSAVAVESIFDWPGVGSYAVNAILTSDYKAVLAVTLVVGLIYSIVNILVDVVHAWLDPRVVEKL
ncbi:ABC transporter permease [Bradyrhizobium erythrophlei]|jgi:peptide/nickel transport system permease protein|uniref:Peptide/nickel transport system permease protein n=1 Tax=Bradyrhizobium erythrophlei TaxID=1437360 RepID=A0A1M5VCJ7_9BRAD|nr:ABC transporter permease [Bradyrhizobium erythrophlei]SHH72643.1 peptide/nickel transport system permease protein [Bradyrhizobium erythrophlei]